MLIDCHVHTNPESQSKEDLIRQLDAAGVDRIILMSFNPASFCGTGTADQYGKPLSPAAALEGLMEWAAFSGRIVPFYWIDPLEEDAFDQVDKAVAAGVAGFKVICNRHFPGDDRPMQVWERIAGTGKPMLFHSGILYGNGPWSRYNRPVGFEPLFDIPKLRFALAHVSWPWCDENLAVYGYWRDRKEHGTTSAEMFIDTTPGTPRIFRREVFNKIYSIGFDIEDNIIFGTDCDTGYSSEYAKQILAMDKDALDYAGATAAQREKYYCQNVLRFLGSSAKD
ncbi:MAG: amidohydrolase [Treponema sp.]|jgi:predicted TIM-barrel fold metal-dependent hydrolase|nr:amidohydrolase [Treponema sp.]